MGFPPLTADEQASLVSRIRAGSADAETRFVELFSRPVRVMVRIRTRRALEEEDLSQEALMAAIQAIRRGQLRDADRLGAFVAGIARNVVNNRLRSAGRVALEPLSGHEEAAVADLRDEMARRERTAMVRRALGALSAEDRQVLALTLIDGLRSTQVAEHLGLTEEAVRARKSRALKRLKGRLDT